LEAEPGVVKGEKKGRASAAERGKKPQVGREVELREDKESGTSVLERGKGKAEVQKEQWRLHPRKGNALRDPILGKRWAGEKGRKERRDQELRCRKGAG